MRRTIFVLALCGVLGSSRGIHRPDVATNEVLEPTTANSLRRVDGQEEREPQSWGRFKMLLEPTPAPTPEPASDDAPPAPASASGGANTDKTKMSFGQRVKAWKDGLKTVAAEKPKEWKRYLLAKFRTSSVKTEVYFDKIKKETAELTPDALKEKVTSIKEELKTQKEEHPLAFMATQTGGKIGARAIVGVATCGATELIKDVLIGTKIAVNTLKDVYEWGTHLADIHDAKLTAAAKMACAAKETGGLVTAVVQGGLTTFVEGEFDVDLGEAYDAMQTAYESAQEAKTFVAETAGTAAADAATAAVDEAKDAAITLASEVKEWTGTQLEAHSVMTKMSMSNPTDEILKSVRIGTEERMEMAGKAIAASETAVDEIADEGIKEVAEAVEARVQGAQDGQVKKALRQLKLIVGFDCNQLCMLAKLNADQKAIAEAAIAAGSMDGDKPACQGPKNTFALGRFQCQYAPKMKTSKTGRKIQWRKAMACQALSESPEERNAAIAADADDKGRVAVVDQKIIDYGDGTEMPRVVTESMARVALDALATATGD